MIFDIGDRVKIKRGSRYYGISDNLPKGITDSNPKDVPGSVYYTTQDIITVHWDNGTRNAYREYDLVICGEDLPVFKGLRNV